MYWVYGDRTLVRFLAGKADLGSISIGPRQTYSVTDAANQSIAASTCAVVSIGFANLGGTNIPLNPDQALYIELGTMRIASMDASGKIQIALLSWLPQVAQPQNQTPFTLPPVSGANYDVAFKFPLMVASNGAATTYAASGSVVLNNTDTAAHTYKRSLTIGWRYIDGIDFSRGPSLERNSDLINQGRNFYGVAQS